MYVLYIITALASHCVYKALKHSIHSIILVLRQYNEYNHKDFTLNKFNLSCEYAIAIQSVS